MRGAVITTYQSGKVIRYTLESLRGFMDAICIVDGRWTKYANQVSTSMMPQMIDNDPKYIKLVEVIEKNLSRYSTDDTIDIAESFRNKFPIFNIIVNKTEEERRGECAARSQAYKWILDCGQKIDWIYVVDSDEIWTDALKSEVAAIEKERNDDSPWRLEMKAKVFVSKYRYFNSDYRRGWKVNSTLADFFCAACDIPCYTEPTKNPRKTIPPSPEYYLKTKEYFIHNSMPDESYDFLRSLCYGAYGIKLFIEHIGEEWQNVYKQHFGANRILEKEASNELADILDGKIDNFSV